VKHKVNNVMQQTPIGAATSTDKGDCLLEFGKFITIGCQLRTDRLSPACLKSAATWADFARADR
jgi:hypothetical protein